MKKILALASFLLIASACTNQPTTTNTTTPASTPATKSAAPSEADAIANEKAIWDTLKKKDLVAFGNMLTNDYIEVGDDGVFDKAAIIADVKNLDLTEATFSNWKTIPIDNDGVILTYDTQLKGTFKGQPIPAGTYHSAAVWVNRDGKWQDFFYQQTLVKTEPPPQAPPAATKSAAAPAAKPGVTGPDPIANEKIVWDLFRARNTEGFGTLLDPGFVEIEENAVYDKAAAVKGAEFDASMFSLSEWKAAKVDNDAALVTYLVKSTDPKMDPQRHTTIWANRGGKWVALLHMGTTVAKAPVAKPEAKKM
jgi:hypothetical protein